MNNYTVDLAPSIGNQVMDLVKILFAKQFALTIISALAVAGLTYGLLSLFMKPGLTFKYVKQDVPEKFKIAFVILLLTIVPSATAISFIIAGRAMNFTESLSTFGIAFGMSLAIAFIGSLYMRKYIPKEERKHKWFLIVEMMNIVIETIGQYIGEWIARGLMSIVNLGIKIVHKPFIMEYAIISVILNLLFSFMLIGLMGVSKDAGYVNIIGSLIGGAIHYVINRKRIKELKQEYNNKEEQHAELGNTSGNSK